MQFLHEHQTKRQRKSSIKPAKQTSFLCWTFFCLNTHFSVVIKLVYLNSVKMSDRRSKKIKMTPFMAFMHFKRGQLEKNGKKFKRGWRDVAAVVHTEWAVSYSHILILFF
jgi:hypothetical protein